jgi:hypothetical protein
MSNYNKPKLVKKILELRSHLDEVYQKPCRWQVWKVMCVPVSQSIRRVPNQTLYNRAKDSSRDRRFPNGEAGTSLPIRCFQYNSWNITSVFHVWPVSDVAYLSRQTASF